MIMDCVGDGFNFEHRVKVACHSDAANRLDPDAITMRKPLAPKETDHVRIGARVKAVRLRISGMFRPRLRFSGAAGCMNMPGKPLVSFLSSGGVKGIGHTKMFRRRAIV